MSHACAACGAPIIWARLATDDVCAYDAQPSAAGRAELVRVGGYYRAIEHEGPNGRSCGGLYTRHETTCTRGAR